MAGIYYSVFSFVVMNWLLVSGVPENYFSSVVAGGEDAVVEVVVAYILDLCFVVVEVAEGRYFIAFGFC